MKNTVSRLLFIFLISLIASGQDERPIGNNFDLGEMANEGDFACILSFKSLGLRDSGESNCWVYLDSEIEISSLLFKKKIQKHRIEFTQRGFPPEEMQDLPDIGRKYLAVGFFNADESLAIRKLADPTISNIEIVEEAAVRRGIQPEDYVRAVIKNKRPSLKSRTLIDENSVESHHSSDQKGSAAGLVSHGPRWWVLGSGLAILFIAICYKVRAFRRARS